MLELKTPEMLAPLQLIKIIPLKLVAPGIMLVQLMLIFKILRMLGILFNCLCWKILLLLGIKLFMLLKLLLLGLMMGMLGIMLGMLVVILLVLVILVFLLGMIILELLLVLPR